ncbi:MAG: trimethylamine methyltransferase family protein [Deltaproteobacteria bacterium]|nr:trimethylamine methyltransferase family protein [Deltaproteobacteria bacterium]MBW2542590.1 trimethylamine methyltransferase family protein [Deltaproteobacteria bacterium]
MTFLNEQEQTLIHEQSIKTLEKIGVQVQSRSVLELLEQKGAAVDYDAMIAKLPEKLVNASLETAPKEFSLCARDPKHDLKFPSYPYPYATTSGLAVKVTDLRTGEYRASTRKDAAEFAKLADALNPVDFLWTSLTATDVPAFAHGPHELWATMQNTSKHVQGVTVQSAEDARVQVELAALVAGGSDALRARPLMSVISCPIAPLSFERGAIEAQVEFARAGIPICSMSMSMGGITAPVTVAGTITNANTENLASIVITQAACPGSPHIYTSESAPMDMQTGAINYSAPEKTLIAIGLGEMANRYGIPCLVSDIGFGDETHPNVGPFSDLAIQIMGVASRTDILTGMGCVDSAKGICFGQLVVDAYIWECVREFMKEVHVTEERIGLDAVAEVGHAHHFLKSKHTRRFMRDEITQWDPSKVEMLSSDAKTVIAEANRIAEQLLKDHQVLAFDEDLIQQGDEIIRAYEGRLAA